MVKRSHRGWPIPLVWLLMILVVMKCQVMMVMTTMMKMVVFEKANGQRTMTGFITVPVPRKSI